MFLSLHVYGLSCPGGLGRGCASGPFLGRLVHLYPCCIKSLNLVIPRPHLAASATCHLFHCPVFRVPGVLQLYRLDSVPVALSQ